MSHWTTSFRVALRFTLLGHMNNRLALLMAAVLNPGWVWIIGVCVPRTDLTFRISTLDLQVATDVSHSMQITSSLPGAASIIGFMMFMTTFKARAMDQRLILAGYFRTALTAARFVAMAVVAAALATQITVLLRLASGAQQLDTLWLAGFSATLAYGGIGTMFGMLLRSELGGLFFVLAMIFMELTLQNPLTNPQADQDWLAVLPLYGPNQTATAAVFTHTGPGGGPAALGFLWCAATVGAAAALLYARTRRYGRHTTPAEAVVPARRSASGNRDRTPGKHT